MDQDTEDIQPPQIVTLSDVQKDFSVWSSLKQIVHNSPTVRPFYHEREIWWCRTGLNIGFESDGKGEEYVRPVLILKGISRHIFVGIPITTKNKTSKHHVSLDLKDGLERKAVISQIRSLDSKRLVDKMAVVDVNTFMKIQQTVIDMFR
jgi:mRNA interferase MazF